MKLFHGVVWLACAFPLFSQNTIEGVVLDARGGAAAQVLIRASRAAEQKQTQSDSQGFYRLDGIASGEWTIRFELAGFEPAVRKLVVTDQPLQLNISLELGAVSASIDVSAIADKATASRMAVPDRELPVQVSAASRETLEAQGVNDMVAALRNVSGATAFRAYGVYEYYTIRGFNSSNVMLVDGMRLEGNRMNTQLNNVERVEVLKGPASVLYGGQALSGTINIVRKKPQAQRTYDLFYRGGRFNTHQAGGGAAGQVFGLSSLLYRADFSLERSDAWRDAGTKRLNFSPALTWIISEGSRLTVTQAWNRDNFSGDAGVPVGVIGRPDFNPARRFNTQQDFASNRDSQTNALFLYSLPHNFQLRHSFLYRRMNDEYFTTESLTYQPALNQVGRQFLYFKHHRRPILNQADVTGSFRFLGLHHTVLAGHEYQDYYNFTNRSASRSVATTAISLASYAETHIPVPDFPISRVDYTANRIDAFFWQDQIAIGERLRFNIGGRYDRYHSLFHNDPWANNQQTSRTPDSRREQTAYTYRAGLVYLLPTNQQVYFSSSSSFQPINTIPADGRQLNPETGRGFEFGHRWQGWNGRIHLSSAVYYLARQNVLIALPNQQYDQAGQQSARGLDFDMNAQLGKGFLLNGNYGYALPRYDDYFTSNRTINLSGFRPRFTQRHAANVWLTKNWKNGILASIGPRYVSSMFTSDLNDLRLGGWTVWNGLAGIQRSRWSWTVNAENLFNRGRYFMPAQISSQVYPGQPVNVFTTLRFRLQ